MYRHLAAPLAAALISLAPLAAPAQTAPARATETQISLPEYRSALQDYRPYTEEQVAPWRESNDTVGRAGGWRAYAKEARETGAAPKPAEAASQPRADHGKH